MEERKKPTRPFSVIYADAKQALTRQVGNTMAAYGLPIFMAEGILSGILAEIRTNAFEKEKAELIRTFEEPAALEETEEAETTGSEEAPSEPPVIIEAKEIVEGTEVD